MKAVLEVVLVVSALDRASGTTHFLTVKANGTYSLPYRILGSEDTAEALAGTQFKNLLGISPGWVPLTQVGVADGKARTKDGDRAVALLFACVLPEKVNPTVGCVAWVDLAEVKGLRWFADHQELLEQALRRV